MVKVWFRELPSFQTPKLGYENSMLGVFSCDFTVVGNDVIMQRTQRCLGLSETRQVNRHIVIWLARALRALEPSQHDVIGLNCDMKIAPAKWRSQMRFEVADAFWNRSCVLKTHLRPELRRCDFRIAGAKLTSQLRSAARLWHLPTQAGRCILRVPIRNVSALT